MFNIGPTELIVVLILALIVFGPRRLPEIGRTVGRSLREFRRASEEIRDELRLGLEDDEPPRAVPTPPPAVPPTDRTPAAEAPASPGRTEAEAAQQEVEESTTGRLQGADARAGRGPSDGGADARSS